MFGIGNCPPGFTKIKYRVNIESPAPEEMLRKVIDTADKRSPVLDDFTRAIPVERIELKIDKSKGNIAAKQD